MTADPGGLRCHPGHRLYVGGKLDGKVTHLVWATPSDYPLYESTTTIGGSTRHWYERDLDGGGNATYRFIGEGDQFPRHGSAGPGG